MIIDNNESNNTNNTNNTINDATSKKITVITSNKVIVDIPAEITNISNKFKDDSKFNINNICLIQKFIILFILFNYNSL